jgi:hypothetical protein
VKTTGAPWYIWGMQTRLPSKALEGRRVRILHGANVKDGVTGEVKTVDEASGNVTVALDSGTNAVVNWGEGDRWMIIPASVASYV